METAAMKTFDSEIKRETEQQRRKTDAVDSQITN